MSNRQRCCVVGCNPYLRDVEAAKRHKTKTGHRTANWPKRSAEGKRKQKERNAAMAYELADLRRSYFENAYGDKYGDHPHSPEALGQE